MPDSEADTFRKVKIMMICAAGIVTCFAALGVWKLVELTPCLF